MKLPHFAVKYINIAMQNIEIYLCASAINSEKHFKRSTFRYMWSWQRLSIEPAVSISWKRLIHKGVSLTDDAISYSFQSAINPFDQINRNSQVMLLLLYLASTADSFWSMALVFFIGLWRNIWHFQFNVHNCVKLPAR